MDSEGPRRERGRGTRGRGGFRGRGRGRDDRAPGEPRDFRDAPSDRDARSSQFNWRPGQDTSESSEPRGPGFRDGSWRAPQEGTEVREPRGSGFRDGNWRSAQDATEPREPRPRSSEFNWRPGQESNENSESRGARSRGTNWRSNRDNRDFREPRDNREFRDLRESREFRENREFRDPRDNREKPLRPREIRLRLDRSEIKLNESQEARIKQLDEQIKALGKPEEPARSVLEQKLKEIDDEISKLRTTIDQRQQELDSKNRERESYFKARQESDDYVAQQNWLELRDAYNAIQDEFGTLINLRKQKTATLRDMRSKLKVKDQEAAVQRMEEIDEIVESATLSNNELKKLLNEKERLRNVSKSLDGVTKLDQEVQDLNAQIQAKGSERDELRQRFEAARQARTNAQKSIDEHRARATKFAEETSTIQAQIDEAYQGIKEKRTERGAVQREHYQAVDEYHRKNREIEDLERAQSEILKEAERRQFQILEAQKRMGDFKERKNPNEERLTAGRSLIAYLEDLVEQDTDKVESPQVEATPKASKAALDFVAKFRQQTPKKQPKKQGKKKNTQTPSKPSTLSHALQTLNQFQIVEEAPPKKVEEIPPVLQSIKAKVRTWADAFVCARVHIDPQSDGKVRVKITMA